MTVTDIYEAMNSKAEAFFEWLQAHPKYGLLFGVGLLALWLAGLLFRWNGRVIGSLTANCGYLMIASLKHAAGFRLCWSAF